MASRASEPRCRRRRAATPSATSGSAWDQPVEADDQQGGQGGAVHPEVGRVVEAVGLERRAAAALGGPAQDAGHAHADQHGDREHGHAPARLPRLAPLDQAAHAREHQAGRGPHEEDPLPQGRQVLELAVAVGVVLVRRRGRFGAAPGSWRPRRRGRSAESSAAETRAREPVSQAPAALSATRNAAAATATSGVRPGSASAQDGCLASSALALASVRSCSTASSGSGRRASRRRRISRASAALAG